MVGIRCCTCCKKRAPKKEFYRIVSNGDMNAILDKSYNINSRAIYICKDKKCLELYSKILKKKKVVLKINVNIDSLIELVDSLKC